MKQILKNTSLSKAQNAMHHQFHHDILDVITESFATSYNIDSLRTAYKELFDKENIAFRQAKIPVSNTDVKTKDAARNERFNYISLSIKAYLYSPNKNENEAAERLYIRTQPHRNALQKSYVEKTVLIDNMVKVLLSAEYSPCTELLGLTDPMHQLKKANDDFHDVYLRYCMERQSRRQIENMKSIRPQVDKAYHSLVEMINSFYRVNFLITHDEATEAALSAIIDGMNAIIFSFSQSVGTRKSKAANKNKSVATKQE